MAMSRFPSNKGIVIVSVISTARPHVRLVRYISPSLGPRGSVWCEPLPRSVSTLGLALGSKLANGSYQLYFPIVYIHHEKRGVPESPAQ